MPTFPSLFVSHGAPDLPLYSLPAVDFLRRLGQQLPQPQAILVISAHWTTRIPTVSAAARPETIHDFFGFPAAVGELQYSAAGAPQLAEQVYRGLHQAGLEAAIAPNRGLDHGAWEPLLLMYPTAAIPVTQLSIQPGLDPAYHLRLGQALAPLRQEGVLILASGAATHNLRAFGAYGLEAPPVAWATAFDQWLAEAIARNDQAALLNYYQQAPFAAENHPTAEHLLPLFVALGAGDLADGYQLHSSFTYGVLSMAAYGFGTEAAALKTALDQAALPAPALA